MPRYEAFRQAHFPSTPAHYEKALQRLKLEELFLAQVRLNLIKSRRHRFSKGIVFGQVGDLFNTFYKSYLPFALTGAQKRVLKEIRNDTAHGRQMNRLLQGDVGSGKTIVALLCMLLAADNGYQACLMAPTEILANQHFNSVRELLKDMPVQTALLTGSTKKAARNKILAALEEGSLHFLIGTHAIIEEVVKFKKPGAGGGRRAAPVWRGPAGPPVEEGRYAAPCTGYDGNAHPPYAGHDGLRRFRLQRDRRTAPGPQTHYHGPPL